jgi:hypothetical protein
VEGRQYRTLEVSDATVFPDAPGWLCIGFGNSTAVFPVRYFGRFNAKALLLDYNFVFPSSNLTTSYSIKTVAKTSGVVDVELYLLPGQTPVAVGNKVYVKYNVGVGMTSGFVTVASLTASGFTYAEAGGDVATINNPGTVVVTGANVTLLQGKGSYVPANANELGSFYITASPAGRVAAESAIEEATAAGVSINTQIVYPSDYGLGNAGDPASGTNKLSDKVVVWGGDEIDAEVAAARSSGNG